MSRSGFYSHVHCKSAAELLDELSPHHGSVLWDRPRPFDWVFRGHAESTWSLTPSALRRGFLEPFARHLRRPLPTTPAEQREFEHHLVLEFVGRAKGRGYEIPYDSPDSGHVSGDGLNVDFPPRRFRAMYGLAQHYGVPTRLLDWTESPLYAAYFAAAGVARRVHAGPRRANGSDRRLAVWAADKEFLGAALPLVEPGATLITAPRSSNPNLHAQKGLFSLVRHLKPPTPDAHPPDLDDLIRRMPAGSLMRNGRLVTGAKLCKFTLPHSEASALLYLLLRYDVTESIVFPGLDSITKELRDAALIVGRRPLGRRISKARRRST